MVPNLGRVEAKKMFMFKCPLEGGEECNDREGYRMFVPNNLRLPSRHCASSRWIIPECNLELARFEAGSCRSIIDLSLVALYKPQFP